MPRKEFVPHGAASGPWELEAQKVNAARATLADLAKRLDAKHDALSQLRQEVAAALTPGGTPGSAKLLTLIARTRQAFT